jgi:hypothetical protein
MNRSERDIAVSGDRFRISRNNKAIRIVDLIFEKEDYGIEKEYKEQVKVLKKEWKIKALLEIKISRIARELI